MSAVKDADVHVGETPVDFPLEDRAHIHFHNFADLPHEKGVFVKSQKFICAGHEWNLWVYPRGFSEAKVGMVSVYLGSESPSKFVVNFDIVMKKAKGDIFTRKTDNFNVTFPRPDNMVWGWNDYAKRDAILDTSNGVLNNGTLTIEVRIRPHSDYYCRDVKPQPTSGENIFAIFGDKESADVAFRVKRRVFYAHKAILKAQTPELAELVESFDKTKPLPIKDVEPEIFETMLQVVYMKSIGAEEWKEKSKQILEASGKYGFTNLKLEAEAWHVKHLKGKLTVENAVDELLYADGKNCPLLKKAAMDFIVERGAEVLDSHSYDKLDESPQLRKEVMRAFCSKVESNKRKRN